MMMTRCDHMGGEVNGSLSVDMVPPSLSRVSPLHPATISSSHVFLCIISLSIDLGRILGTKGFL